MSDYLFTKQNDGYSLKLPVYTCNDLIFINVVKYKPVRFELTFKVISYNLILNTERRKIQLLVSWNVTNEFTPQCN